MSNCTAAVFLLPNIQFVSCAHFFFQIAHLPSCQKKERKKQKNNHNTFSKRKKEKRKKEKQTQKTYDITVHDVIYKITSPWQSHGFSVCLPLLVFLYNYFIDWNQFWCNHQPGTPPPLSSPKKDIWVLTVRWWQERVHAKQAKVQHNLWALEGGCLNQRKEEEASSQWWLGTVLVRASIWQLPVSSTIVRYTLHN